LSKEGGKIKKRGYTPFPGIGVPRCKEGQEGDFRPLHPSLKRPVILSVSKNPPFKGSASARGGASPLSSYFPLSNTNKNGLEKQLFERGSGGE